MLKKNTVFKVLLMITFGFLLPREPIYSSEQSTYNFSWLDPDKEVYVLQNRKYRKKGHLFIHAGYGITTSGPFVDSTSLQGRAGYFVTEVWGMQFLYAKNNGSENDTAHAVRDQGGGAGSRPFRRIVDNYMGALLLWSPFYAKINTFNLILYFDWIFGLGYAKMEETNNRNEVATGGINTVPVNENHQCLIWETAFQLYLSKNYNLRLNLTTLHYEAQKALSTSTADDKSWYSNYDVTLSLGVTF